MFKKNKIFFYQMKLDMLYIFISLISIAAIIFVFSFIDKDYSTNIMDLETFMTAILVLNVSASLSSQQYEQYITFRFCRKKFYHEQVILCIIRAAFISLLRTLLQFINYNEYVQAFIEDTTNTPDLYHPVSFPELFFTNLCAFLLVYLIFLVNSSHTITIALNKIAKSPQLQLRIQLKKEQHKTLHTCLTIVIKTVSFILLIAWILGLLIYHQMQLQNSLSERMTALGVVIVLCGIVYLHGRRRFCPKYV